MTDFTLRAILAVKTSRREAANNFWKNNIDPAGGERTFSAGLSASGEAPATWYWCATSLTKPMILDVKNGLTQLPASDYRVVIWPTPWGKVNDILEHFADNGGSIRVLTDETMTPQDVLDAAGMQVVSDES